VLSISLAELLAPRDTPFPLKAANPLDFDSSWGRELLPEPDGGASVEVELELPPPKKLDIIPPDPEFDDDWFLEG